MRWRIVIALLALWPSAAFACMIDGDCSPGSRCVKGSSLSGVCTGGQFPGNSNDRQPARSPLDPKAGNTCTYDADCGAQNQCAKGARTNGVCVHR